MKFHARACDEDRDAGQMLLATGVVLLMSLLSMAIFGVKVAGMTLPHDSASDSVIITTEEVVDNLPTLVESRIVIWVDGGMDRLEAAEVSLASAHDDLLHHGEIKGVEIKLIDLQATDLDGSSMQITGELGVSDGAAMLTTQIDFTLNV